MDTLPIAVDDVKKEIVSLIEKKGLDTLTSATIRAHLKVKQCSFIIHVLYRRFLIRISQNIKKL